MLCETRKRRPSNDALVFYQLGEGIKAEYNARLSRDRHFYTKWALKRSRVSAVCARFLSAGSCCWRAGRGDVWVPV